MVHYEVDQSKQVLEKWLGFPVISFAYPYGAFDKQAMEVVKEAGFKTAVSTVPGIEVTNDNRLFLFRLRPGQRSGVSLIDFLKSSSFKEF